ncbi:MAG: alpha/beta fold hydrolase [Flavobacteriaceae bacterium]|nr:alpha/beta fold hydrolase [Flavobacteriaceae bacterium]
MKALAEVTIDDFVSEKNVHFPSLTLTYEVFGHSLDTKPVVLVVHALTGNSTVTGDQGWWNQVVGYQKVIDTEKFSVVAFNIPGNGYSGKPESFLEDYKSLTARDVAILFHDALQKLGVTKLFAAIGGSVGGGIIWELATHAPTFVQNLIPIASDWKATDWLLANTQIQDLILNHSSHPIEDARIHAMTLYRTPQSLRHKFNRTLNEDLGIHNVESWLLHHGEKLTNRFTLQAYKALNYQLSSINITRGRACFETVVEPIQSHIHIISVDTDLFFTPDENRKTFTCLNKLHKNVYYHQIQSIHGHDAFLIENDQLNKILSGIFVQEEILAAF